MADDIQGNFLSNVAVNKQPGEKQPTTNLKYPDRKFWTILN